MKKYYFTHGCDAGGGWTVVHAESEEQAETLFSVYHPMKNGMLDCCFVYSEDYFEKSPMYKNGNFGTYCVEEIRVKRIIYSGGKA